MMPDFFGKENPPFLVFWTHILSSGNSTAEAKEISWMCKAKVSVHGKTDVIGYATI